MPKPASRPVPPGQADIDAIYLQLWGTPTSYADGLQELAEYPHAVFNRLAESPTVRGNYRNNMHTAAALTGEFATNLTNPYSVHALCLLGCVALEVLRPLERIEGLERGQAQRQRAKLLADAVEALKGARTGRGQ